MQKAREVIGWDQYFINVTREVATRSKDPSTQVGCVIVDQKHRPISFGYNGFLSAGDDSYLTWERPMKYYFSIHAEMNAILFAKRDLEGCKLYCSYACCENCLKFIIQAGIKEVVYDKPFLNSYTSGSNTSMSHPEAFEAATRLIQSAESLGFSMRNINGTSYLEEMWGGKDKIPDFREK
ncbi:MAG: dCMP deaminase family protein [Candidatus Absconditabacteria bacterium]|nr:dCMP deaminase family protein [Candidatus Absconditabacteria bacterium]MDD3868449.1 dCMP deaminase family protein [Candidatus Absconditabacteria bacterium]MDD4713977.1 dCMP deaminase family protein [Candidatus Absconditabacteria bacterium]